MAGEQDKAETPNCDHYPEFTAFPNAERTPFLKLGRSEPFYYFKNLTVPKYGKVQNEIVIRIL